MLEHMEFARDAAIMNRALDDMDAVSGFITLGGRTPVAEFVEMILNSPNHNDINIQNSQAVLLVQDNQRTLTQQLRYSRDLMRTKLADIFYY